MQNTCSHLGEETLELYVLGSLPEEQIPYCEEHILVCDICRDRLEEAEHYIQVVSAAARELETERAKAGSFNPASKLSWLWALPKPVWAGAFAAVLAMVVIPSYWQSHPPAITEIQMNASRGSSDTLIAQAPVGKVVLLLDTSELPSMPAYRVQLVDSSGREVWSGTVSASDHRIRTTVPSPLEADNYWVRLYSPDGASLLRESGLVVK